MEMLKYENEVRTEIMIDDVSWYSIDVDRMLVEPDGDNAPLFFTIDVRHHLDDGSNDNTPTVTLIGGTGTLTDDGEHLMIATRKEALKQYYLVLQELLSLIYTKRQPQSPLLEHMKTLDKMEKFRLELEDSWNIVIE